VFRLDRIRVSRVERRPVGLLIVRALVDPRAATTALEEEADQVAALAVHGSAKVVDDDDEAAPRRAISIAYRRPSPRPAPVTTATWPPKSIMAAFPVVD
jgi:hypothetical protein